MRFARHRSSKRLRACGSRCSRATSARFRPAVVPTVLSPQAAPATCVRALVFPRPGRRATSEIEPARIRDSRTPIVAASIPWLPGIAVQPLPQRWVPADSAVNPGVSARSLLRAALGRRQRLVRAARCSVGPARRRPAEIAHWVVNLPASGSSLRPRAIRRREGRRTSIRRAAAAVAIGTALLPARVPWGAATVRMPARTAELARNLICASPSRTVRTADMAEAMVGIAPLTVGRARRPTMAADVPPAEAGVPSPEVAVAGDTVVAAEAVIPVAGGTPAEAIAKFETFERVEVSCKLL